MEWIINQLRVHPELAIFLTLFRGILAGKTENREILFRYSDQRPSGRSIGRTIEHYSRRSVKSRIFSTLFVCRWLQGRSAILFAD